MSSDEASTRDRSSTPYSNLPARQRWSHAVARSFDVDQLGTFPRPLIAQSDRVMSAGSCFAANLVPYLQQSGFDFIRTEQKSAIYRFIAPEAMSYGQYSAAYGNIYTPRQLRQLLARSLGEFRPVEDRWQAADGVIDPFRPGLRYKARSDREFDLLTATHLKAVREAFEACDVFIFTLGLTEAWLSASDGAVFPACPGTVAGTFDAEKHVFRNFGLDEMLDDLRAFIAALRAINPDVRLIFTVSPVPLVATAEGRHVLEATTYSKSLLRVAAEMICREADNAFYFPAYEIVTGPQAPEDFFEADRRSVSRQGVDTVMAVFLAACEPPAQTVVRIRRGDAAASEEALSAAIADAECEEVAQLGGASKGRS
ncbi:GSCFA domain-containing protein [Rhizobium sp.]